jgi:hypothetical protein
MEPAIATENDSSPNIQLQLANSLAAAHTPGQSMANRRSFKTDESFLEKLAIGAIGARAVFECLKRQGHRPIDWSAVR